MAWFGRFAKKTFRFDAIKTTCSCHVTYAFQSESTLASCQNVKALLARNRRVIWSLSDCNGARTYNHLVCKPILNHLAKLASLVKWVNVRLQAKWLWVRVMFHLCHRESVFMAFTHSLKLRHITVKQVFWTAHFPLELFHISKRYGKNALFVNWASGLQYCIYVIHNPLELKNVTSIWSYFETF